MDIACVLEVDYTAGGGGGGNGLGLDSINFVFDELDPSVLVGGRGSGNEGISTDDPLSVVGGCVVGGRDSGNKGSSINGDVKDNDDIDDGYDNDNDGNDNER